MLTSHVKYPNPSYTFKINSFLYVYAPIHRIVIAFMSWIAAVLPTMFYHTHTAYHCVFIFRVCRKKHTHPLRVIYIRVHFFSSFWISTRLAKTSHTHTHGHIFPVHMIILKKLGGNINVFKTTMENNVTITPKLPIVIIIAWKLAKHTHTCTNSLCLSLRSKLKMFISRL